MWNDQQETASVIMIVGTRSNPLFFVIINLKIYAKWFILKGTFFGQGKRLYQCPCKTWFRLQVTVNRKRIIFWIKDVVFSWFRGTVLSDVLTTRWLCPLTPLTSIFVRTATWKSDAVSVAYLLTYPLIETRIGSAASVDAAMLPWDVFASTLQQNLTFN